MARTRKTEPVIEDPKRRLLDVCRHRAPACWPCVAQDMERQRNEAEATSKDLYAALAALDAMYAHAWDLVDGGLHLSPASVARFEKLHEAATGALARARGETP